jgi:hypothetical protein
MRSVLVFAEAAAPNTLTPKRETFAFAIASPD